MFSDFFKIFDGVAEPPKFGGPQPGLWSVDPHSAGSRCFINADPDPA